jgi:hypothetical protein
MAASACVNCVYSICDPELWLRRLWAGEPLLPRCANHPRWPGQLRDVPGVACRNYRPKPVLPEGDVRLIPLGDGFYAYVDAADYEWLRQWNWRLSDGYAFRYENGKKVYMHREIMKAPKNRVVDHMDGNRANDCRCNLRICTSCENQRNKRKRHHASSRFKGVGYRKCLHKWCAQWQRHPGKCWLGSFDGEIEAARAYDYAAVAWFGASSGLNFPAEWPAERRAQVYAATQAEREAVLAKLAQAKRRRARKARAKEQEAKGRKQKPSKTTAPRTKKLKGKERKRPVQDVNQATGKLPPKHRRT